VLTRLFEGKWQEGQMHHKKLIFGHHKSQKWRHFVSQKVKNGAIFLYLREDTSETCSAEETFSVRHRAI
jgi:hypothetical protein